MSGLVVSSTSGTRRGALPSSFPGAVAGLGSPRALDPAASRGRRLKRSVKWAANLHAAPRRGERTWRAWMVTLTYAAVDGWSPAHISAALRRFREYLRRRCLQLRYTWVAELQKRGAVHYHVLVWLPASMSMPKWDKQGWWPHGMTERARARKPVGYMVKYASKFDGCREFPKGLRTHGAGGFSTDQRPVRHWLGLPGWLRQQVGVGTRIDRLKGGGFAVRESGEIVPSPWRHHCREGVSWVRELWRYVDGIPATGPYSRIPPLQFVRGPVPAEVVS
jgi:hypothetical protein